MPARADEKERTYTALPSIAAASERHGFLLVLSGPQFGGVFPLPLEREIVIGRREDADLRIPDEAVSRRHASVRVDGTGAVLRDLESANGTWIEGRRVREEKLADGARPDRGRDHASSSSGRTSSRRAGR